MLNKNVLLTRCLEHILPLRNSLALSWRTRKQGYLPLYSESLAFVLSSLISESPAQEQKIDDSFS